MNRNTKAALKRSTFLLFFCTLVLCAELSADRIERSEYLSVNGDGLYLLIRGSQARDPILLWLHGGPGGAERPLFRYFNSEIERHFVVAYWDQRGAGRSFNPKADPHRLTITQHVEDLDIVVDHLRKNLNQDKVVLVGHSWGAALGMLYAQMHPSKVSAVVAVNPLISTREGEQAQYNFVLAQASARHHRKVLARLHKIGTPPFQNFRQVLEIQRLVDHYGGVFHRKPRQSWVLLRATLTGLVTPWEVYRLIRANNVTLQAMQHEFLDLDLRRSAPEVDVPVSFFLGRYDKQADAEIAAEYLKVLHAPMKRLVWFEHSAHNIPFEEADRFNAVLEGELQSIGLAGN